MNNNKVILTILILLPSLTSCWGITFESDTPTEYIELKNKIEARYGSTQEEIVTELGEPVLIRKRGNATYYIYQWKRSDKDIIFFVVPIPVAGGRANVHIHCLLLEFNRDNRLINHEAVIETVDDHVNPWWETAQERDCGRIFNLRW